MTKTIEEALQALDPKNDAHWTSDGSPRMEVLQELTGNEGLTRKQVREAAPTFTRETAGEAPPEAPGISPETEQGATTAPPLEGDQDENETLPDDEQEQADQDAADEQDEADLAEETELTALLAEADAELAEAEADLNERRKVVDEVRARRDQLVEARERERTVHDDQIERMRFIKRQAALRAERAGENALATELALQARGLAGASALDQSMARRLGRGRDRPAARPLKNVKE
jgi:hypothetical protein